MSPCFWSAWGFVVPMMTAAAHGVWSIFYPCLILLTSSVVYHSTPQHHPAWRRRRAVDMTLSFGFSGGFTAAAPWMLPPAYATRVLTASVTALALYLCMAKRSPWWHSVMHGVVFTGVTEFVHGVQCQRDMIDR